MLYPHAVHIARTSHCLLLPSPTLHVFQVVLIILNSLSSHSLHGGLPAVLVIPLPVPWSGISFLEWEEAFILLYQLHQKQGYVFPKGFHGCCPADPPTLAKLASQGLCQSLTGSTLLSHTQLWLFLIPGVLSLKTACGFPPWALLPCRLL